MGCGDRRAACLYKTCHQRLSEKHHAQYVIYSSVCTARCPRVAADGCHTPFKHIIQSLGLSLVQAQHTASHPNHLTAHTQLPTAHLLRHTQPAIRLLASTHLHSCLHPPVALGYLTHHTHTGGCGGTKVPHAPHLLQTTTRGPHNQPTNPPQHGTHTQCSFVQCNQHQHTPASTPQHITSPLYMRCALPADAAARQAAGNGFICAAVPYRTQGVNRLPSFNSRHRAARLCSTCFQPQDQEARRDTNQHCKGGSCCCCCCQALLLLLCAAAAAVPPLCLGGGTSLEHAVEDLPMCECAGHDKISKQGGDAPPATDDASKLHSHAHTWRRTHTHTAIQSALHTTTRRAGRRAQ